MSDQMRAFLGRVSHILRPYLLDCQRMLARIREFATGTFSLRDEGPATWTA